ncbi:hypothetical protein XELAEV_180357381mg, partial [Xenopus laevis]
NLTTATTESKTMTSQLFSTASITETNKLNPTSFSTEVPSTSTEFSSAIQTSSLASSSKTEMPIVTLRTTIPSETSVQYTETPTRTNIPNTTNQISEAISIIASSPRTTMSTMHETESSISSTISSEAPNTFSSTTTTVPNETHSVTSLSVTSEQSTLYLTSLSTTEIPSTHTEISSAGSTSSLASPIRTESTMVSLKSTSSLRTSSNELLSSSSTHLQTSISGASETHSVTAYPLSSIQTSSFSTKQSTVTIQNATSFKTSLSSISQHISTIESTSSATRNATTVSEQSTSLSMSEKPSLNTETSVAFNTTSPGSQRSTVQPVTSQNITSTESPTSKPLSKPSLQTTSVSALPVLSTTLRTSNVATTNSGSRITSSTALQTSNNKTLLTTSSQSTTIVSTASTGSSQGKTMNSSTSAQRTSTVPNTFSTSAPTSTLQCTSSEKQNCTYNAFTQQCDCVCNKYYIGSSCEYGQNNTSAVVDNSTVPRKKIRVELYVNQSFPNTLLDKTSQDYIRMTAMMIKIVKHVNTIELMNCNDKGIGYSFKGRTFTARSDMLCNNAGVMKCRMKSQRCCDTTIGCRRSMQRLHPTVVSRRINGATPSDNEFTYLTPVYRKASPLYFNGVEITGYREGSIIVESAGLYLYPNNQTGIDFLNNNLETTVNKTFLESLSNLTNELNSNTSLHNISSGASTIKDISQMKNYVSCSVGYSGYLVHCDNQSCYCTGPCFNIPAYCNYHGDCFNALNGPICQCYTFQYYQYGGKQCDLFTRTGGFYGVLFGVLGSALLLLLVLLFAILVFKRKRKFGAFKERRDSRRWFTLDEESSHFPHTDMDEVARASGFGNLTFRSGSYNVEKTRSTSRLKSSADIGRLFFHHTRNEYWTKICFVQYYLCVYGHLNNGRCLGAFKGTRSKFSVQLDRRADRYPSLLPISFHIQRPQLIVPSDEQT